MPIRTENQEKVKIIITAACVVFAILLIVSLIISLVSLASASARKNRLEKQLRELNAMIELNQANIDYYSSSEYVEMIAREYLDMQGKGEITFVGK